ncbi:uncharacterized protein LOC124456953 [Xenia sp. Carnegie-2017]|uniref:uncharacterized protein LOC124456953 n=1 Tax=Xenia sp. Carnegie-2017 TaxID=2897299 RepID=UPI001F033ABE|nr:uncharacterized protein LOC124456953 [Xenia sp. Carnegie-2017]
MRYDSTGRHSGMEIKDGLYVDDLMEGGTNVGEVLLKKKKTIEIFSDATFKLHKWHSNAAEMEKSNNDLPEQDIDQTNATYAKEQLGTVDTGAKILGLPWNKLQDTFSVVVEKEESAATTKRGALSQLAKIYDPIGLISPTMLTGKLLYRKMCESRLSWDQEFDDVMGKLWRDWYNRLPNAYTVNRPLAPFHVPVRSIHLHGFGDASKDGVSAVVYSETDQEDNLTQGIVCSKSRISKRNLTIPRLELVAGHMVTNLVINVERAIGKERVTSIHCWLDSTVALCWINGQGEYRQFVANRVRKIQQHHHIVWRHVPTTENPADIGSRGGHVVDNDKAIKGIGRKRYLLRRGTRDERETGPIKYHEIENCTLWWIRREQNWFREQS